MMKHFAIIMFFAVLCLTSAGQNERKFVRQGNRFYLEGIKDTTRLDTLNFSKAETSYRKALSKKPDDLKWNFNLQNSVYKQTKFREAADGYEQLAKQASDPVEKARIYHNLGNSRLFQQQLDESIEAYKKALRNNPSDLETKYNLAFAQRMKKKQEQQQQNRNKNQDQNKDQNKDQQKQNQDQKKDQDKNQDQRNQPQPPPKISKQNAEQLLQALQNDEKSIQEKVQKAKAVQAKSAKIEKDW